MCYRQKASTKRNTNKSSGELEKGKGPKGQRKRNKMKKRGLRKSGGRNNTGRITVRHRGGGHKRLYREIDYRENGHRVELTGRIERVEYDPNRTAYIGECVGQGKKFYKILGGQEMEKEKKSPVQEYMKGKEIKVVRLKEVGVGEEVYNVSMRPGQEGKIGRASGVKCKVLKQEIKHTVIRMPSTEIKRIVNTSTCIMGGVYGKEEKRLGKAGASRRLGIRPSVRGVAMNPIDHPNGGKTPGGQPKTP